MNLFLCFLSLSLFSTFSGYSPDVEAWGAGNNERREFRRLKKQRRRAERNGRHQQFSSQSSSAGHGAAELPGQPAASGAEETLPPAEPDIDEDTPAPGQPTNEGTKEKTEEAEDSQTPTKTKLSEDKKKAVQDAFCGKPNIPNGGVMLSLFYHCHHHTVKGTSITAAEMLADNYNAEATLARDKDPSKREAHQPRLDQLKAFRHHVFGGDLEMMVTNISKSLYRGRTQCKSQNSPPKASLTYPGFTLTCSLEKNSIGKQDCPKKNIQIQDDQGATEKLCP